FDEVLHRLRQQFVQINQGGPEKVTGFVAEVGNSTLLLVANRDVMRIPLFHIKTVSLASRTGGSNNRNNNTNNNNQNQSGGRRQNAGGDNDRNRTQGQGGRTQGGRS